MDFYRNGNLKLEGTRVGKSQGMQRPFGQRIKLGSRLHPGNLVAASFFHHINCFGPGPLAI